HVCETGGGRRSWLRGLGAVSKRYLLQVAGHKLGGIMGRFFGKGTPRSLQGGGAAFVVWLWGGWGAWGGRGTTRGRLLPSDNAIGWCEGQLCWGVSIH